MRCKKDSVVAAIIYMACKEEGVPRTFKEISKETNIPEKEIRKYYRALNKILPKGTGRTSAADLVVRTTHLLASECAQLTVGRRRFCSRTDSVPS